MLLKNWKAQNPPSWKRLMSENLREQLDLWLSLSTDSGDNFQKYFTISKITHFKKSIYVKNACWVLQA